MPSTRSSARLESNGRSSATQREDKAGEKRQAGPTAAKEPVAKKQKHQKKIEETMPGSQRDGKPGETQAESTKSKETTEKGDDGESDGRQSKLDAEDSRQSSQKTSEDSNGAKREQTESSDGAIVKSSDREEAMPSNILERGIIYFFARARVNIENPQKLDDIARSYMVLRPLPDDSKIGGQAPLEDLKNNRLIALPKKYLPKSHSDVFMAFVEKAKVSVQELKNDFLKGNDYETKTSGTRHTPAATPIGEGVYSLTEMGNNTRLAYMLTVPSEPGQVQKEMGIADKGSFVLSIKNPEQKGPPQASLPQGPDYPKEMREEFAGKRWLGNLQPKHLDYANAQMLMIGEGFGDIGKATQATEEDKKSDKKETPEEEMELLEEENERRVEALGGDHAVYQDLKVKKEDYPELKTTW